MCIFAEEIIAYFTHTMPKVLLYITAKLFWIFLFYNKDFNENRAHIHVGKKDTNNLCKIGLSLMSKLPKVAT